MTEQTVVFIKPDGYEKKVIGQVIDRFERAGFTVKALKMLRLDRPFLEVWYAHHKDKPFFPEIVAQFTSGPVVAMILEADGAIQKMIDICGPTDPLEAAPGTIRRDFGESKGKNVVHRSDSTEAATKEISLLFKTPEIF